jgi:hypothetical protein
VLARAVQGVGGSMLLPIGRLAVLRRVPGERYVAAIAFVSTAAQLGPIVGPTLGGWLTQAISWHWVFIVNVPVGMLGFVMVQRFLPHDRAARPPRFDFAGCALLSAAMIALSLAIDPPMAAHRAAWAAGLAALGAASALAYLPHARRRVQPLFRLGLFREPNFGAGLLGNLLCRIGTSAVPFMLPLLMQVQLGYTPLQSGTMMLPAAIAGVIAKRWIAPLAKRFGYSAFLVVNTAIVGTAIAGFALVCRAAGAGARAADRVRRGQLDAVRRDERGDAQGAVARRREQRQQPVHDDADARDGARRVDRRRAGEPVRAAIGRDGERFHAVVRLHGRGYAAVVGRVPSHRRRRVADARRIAAVRVSDGAAESCRKWSAAQPASASQDVGSHDDLTVYRAFRLAPEPKRA